LLYFKNPRTNQLDTLLTSFCQVEKCYYSNIVLVDQSVAQH